jgi:chemotaxis methyl-accepting protein methylase
MGNLILNLLNRNYGLDISSYDRSFLEKSLQKRIAQTHSNSPKEYYNFLQQNSSEEAILLQSLQNSYTDFFRNSLTFSVLEHIVFPSIIQQKKDTTRNEIRVWSAACASGQEPLSLAILLHELISFEEQSLRCRIFATDRNEEQIQEAQKGFFSTQAVANLTQKRLKNWFYKQGDVYAVKPELKATIDFSVFDLFNKQMSCPPASIFGDFDVIMISNLLFYYKPTFQKIILDKVAACLTTNGIVVVGEAERSIMINHNFHETFPNSGVFQPNKKSKNLL